MNYISLKVLENDDEIPLGIGKFNLNIGINIGEVYIIPFILIYIIIPIIPKILFGKNQRG